MPRSLSSDVCWGQGGEWGLAGGGGWGWAVAGCSEKREGEADVQRGAEHSAGPWMPLQRCDSVK